jgi:alpha-tubulin suppressor-like RCC1 family protein
MSANIDNLQIQLQTAINKAAAEAIIDETSDTVYYLQLAKAIQSLNMGQIRTVATFSNLPTAATHEGWLIFVEADERLYFSDGSAWAGIAPITVTQAWAWGSNTNGRLGDNSTINRSSPVSVVGGITTWQQLSAGNAHSLGLTQAGIAYAWGNNSNGRLGDNTITSQISPVTVVGGITNWQQLSAGNAHSLGLRTTGTAWAWGLNTSGQLGDNTGTNKSSPVSVVGGFTDWCQISAGSYHSLGTRQNGTSWAWGCNVDGQLGDNSIVSRSSPVQVLGDFTDWCQLSAGNSHSLGTRQNGTAWAWGNNGYGRLGDNTITSRSSPVSVVGGFTDWCQISAGGCHSLGTRQSGTAWAWGNNAQGRLGDNTVANKSSPVSVVGGFTDWCQVSAGGFHSLGVRTGGTAWAWGNNGQGRLGDDTIVSRSSPVSVVGGFTDWCQVSGGVAHSLAIRSTSQV